MPTKVSGSVGAVRNKREAIRRETANDPEFASPLADATGIWMLQAGMCDGELRFPIEKITRLSRLSMVWL